MWFVYNLFKNNQFPSLKSNTPKSPSRGTLYYRESVGKLIKVLPGFFVPADSILNDENIMQWIHAKQPDAVMNLVSALSFHGLTTQIPAYLSVSLPRGKYIPKNFVTLLMRGSSSIFLIKIDVTFNKYYLNKVVFIFVF